MEVRNARSDGIARNLRTRPLDGKCNWRVAEHAEIVSSMSVFPDVLPVNYQVLSKSLLKTGVKLVPPTGSNRCVGHAAIEGADHSIVAPQAGKHQVLVERRFQGAGIGNPQDGIGRLYVISDAETGFELVRLDDAVVIVETEAEVEGEMVRGDGVLREQGQFADVGVPVEVIEAGGGLRASIGTGKCPRPRQIIAPEYRNE